MKNYTITVNGNVYDVTVEESGAGAVQHQQHQSAAPKAVAPAAPKAAPAAGAGSIQVKAGAAGKVFQIPYIRWSECTGWRYCSRHRGHEDGDPGCCPGSMELLPALMLQ